MKKMLSVVGLAVICLGIFGLFCDSSLDMAIASHSDLDMMVGAIGDCQKCPDPEPECPDGDYSCRAAGEDICEARDARDLSERNVCEDSPGDTCRRKDWQICYIDYTSSPNEESGTCRMGGKNCGNNPNHTTNAVWAFDDCTT